MINTIDNEKSGRSIARTKYALLTILLGLFAAFPAKSLKAETSSLNYRLAALVKAYPEHLWGIDGRFLVWLDGQRTLIDDGKPKTHQQKLKSADIEDMLSQTYPLEACYYATPSKNFDPGRIRSQAFFRKMYGSSQKVVRNNIVSIAWFDRTIQVTRVNDIDIKLSRIARELEQLPHQFHKYVRKIDGAFNWRTIAGTKRLSLHSFGMAIDINKDYADYWRWTGLKGGNAHVIHNKIPHQIIDIFKRYGFIWGGKWYHHDTMHFEYRPEMLAFATTSHNQICN